LGEEKKKPEKEINAEFAEDAEGAEKSRREERRNCGVG
jgi:hypothetical protein